MTPVNPSDIITRLCQWTTIDTDPCGRHDADGTPEQTCPGCATPPGCGAEGPVSRVTHCGRSIVSVRWILIQNGDIPRLFIPLSEAPQAGHDSGIRATESGAR
jgi:hypothetical protein